MKNAMGKDFFREIAHTRSRFVSILILVALSVAFLSGLRSTAPDMKRTGDGYLDSLRLADIQVLSNLGLTDGDLAALLAREEIADGEAAYVLDAYAASETAELVAKVYSLTGRVNDVLLLRGRMPETEGECVADEKLLDLLDLSLGDAVTLTPPDALEGALRRETYAVVGTVRSPVYVSTERGASTLGTGAVKAYLYLPKAAFDLDYYTAIYLRVDGAADMTAFYDDYDERIDGTIDALEPLAEERAQKRHDDLVGEASEKLDDAQRELNGAKAEAAEELAKAERELADARKELDDGYAKLADAERTLARETAKARRELADARAELAGALTGLEGGEASYREGADEWERGRAEYESGLAEYEDGLAAYEKGLAEYEDGRRAYEDGLAAYESSGRQLEDAERALSAGDAELAAARQTLAARQAQLDALALSVAAAMGSDTVTLRAALAAGDAATAAAADAALDGMRGALAAALAPVEAGLALDPTDAGLLAQKASLDAQLASLAGVSAATIASAGAQLDAGWAQYNSGVAQSNAGWEQYTDGLIQLRGAKAELDAAAGGLAGAEAELTNARAELADAEAGLRDAKARLDDARRELAGAREELDAGWAEYNDGLAEADAAEAKLARSAAKARRELADARGALADGEAEYADGLAEYEDAKREAAERIADAEAGLRDARRKVADIESGEWYLMSRGYNPGYTGFGQDADRMGKLAAVFPLIFFLVAALVCLTTMTRMVEEQRVQIGALKALGYGTPAISAKYIGYGLLPSLLGGALGLAVGCTLFPSMIFTAYQIMYEVPDIKLSAYPDVTAFSILAGAACTTFAALAACLASLREAPASLMRPRAPKAGKRVFLEYVKPLWRRMKFTHKVTARNLFRYRKRFWMTVAGIGGCTALIIAGFGLRFSLTYTMDRQYDELFHYTAQLALADNATDEERRELEDLLRADGRILNVTPCGLSAATAVSSRYSISAYVMTLAAEELPVSIELYDAKTGEPMTMRDGGVYIDQKLSELLGVGVGDTFLIDGDARANVSVAGVFEHYAAHFIYMTPAYYEAAFGADAKTGAYLLTFESGDGALCDALFEEFMGYPCVAAATRMADTRDTYLHSMERVDFVVVIIILAAAALAMVVLYNLSNINITERMRELATIKLLGFYDGEVSAYVYRENVVLTAFGIGAGVLMGHWLHVWLIRRVEIDMLMFGRETDPRSYGYAAALTAVFSLLVNLLAHFKMKKIDMVESLKSAE